MEKDTINSYLVNFRRFISPYLKKDVSMKASAYPYDKGAIMVMEMDFNGSSNTEFKAESSDFPSAMSKTNLFDAPEDASPVNGTKIISQRNKIIVIKGDSPEIWSEKSSKNDVENLLESIKNRNNG